MDTATMLTTFDNPFDPFDDFHSWWMFDVDKGYNTCGKLARIARSSSYFSMKEDKEETERAIDEIIDNDFLNIYKKITRDVEDPNYSSRFTDEEVEDDEEE